jgi:hypothetical protein
MSIARDPHQPRSASSIPPQNRAGIISQESHQPACFHTARVRLGRADYTAGAAGPPSIADMNRLGTAPAWAVIFRPRGSRALHRHALFPVTPPPDRRAVIEMHRCSAACIGLDRRRCRVRIMAEHRNRGAHHNDCRFRESASCFQLDQSTALLRANPNPWGIRLARRASRCSRMQQVRIRPFRIGRHSFPTRPLQEHYNVIAGCFACRAGIACSCLNRHEESSHVPRR